MAKQSRCAGRSIAGVDGRADSKLWGRFEPGKENGILTSKGRNVLKRSGFRGRLVFHNQFFGKLVAIREERIARERSSSAIATYITT
jgi:hypothetical protein